MTVTGVGGWPGTHAREAALVVTDTCVGMPHLAELPERGPGGDMIGRTMARLAQVSSDLAVSTVPGGWRLAGSLGRDMVRASGFWSEDLDATEEVLAGYRGPFKVALVGPLTLAASVEDRAGERMLRDPGAVRDLAAALGEAWLALLADLGRRCPGADFVLQVDEPRLAEVLAGTVATQSTWTTYPAIEASLATDLLRRVRQVHTGSAVLHCCAAQVPFDVLAAAGFAPSFDLGLVGSAAVDPVGEQVDAGRRVFLGVDAPTVADGVSAVSRFGAAVGYRAASWSEHIVLTPPCDLVGMPMSAARGTMERLAAVATALVQEDG